jgi:hypothetical protein
VIVCVPAPTAEGVYVTEQLPLTSVQLAAGLKPPEPELENETEPVGVDAVPDDVSLIVAVHVDPWPTTRGVWQLTAVEVERVVTLNAKGLALLLLEEWPLSPP